VVGHLVQLLFRLAKAICGTVASRRIRHQRLVDGSGVSPRFDRVRMEYCRLWLVLNAAIDWPVLLRLAPWTGAWDISFACVRLGSGVGLTNQGRRRQFCSSLLPHCRLDAPTQGFPRFCRAAFQHCLLDDTAWSPGRRLMRLTGVYSGFNRSRLWRLLWCGPRRRHPIRPRPTPSGDAQRAEDVESLTGGTPIEASRWNSKAPPSPRTIRQSRCFYCCGTRCRPENSYRGHSGGVTRKDPRTGR